MATPSRRHFLGGLIAASIAPTATWSDVGTPVFLSAAAGPDSTYMLCGIDAAMQVRFQIPLPARGHAAAAHPVRPEAVAFARRPGTFALVIDCNTGRELARLTSPVGRHFYGHGTFSSEGNLLFTTENDFEAGQGRIGVWDAQNGYRRIDEWDSGGIGPHDIKALPGSDTLVVANGGIDTHPDTGRTKLNIPTMAPCLAYISDGVVVETAKLPQDLHQNSIRHLAIGPKGEVAFAMQWQGDRPVDTLVGLHQRGLGISLLTLPVEEVRHLENYVGSIAFSSDGNSVAVTSPRGGAFQIYDVRTGLLEDDGFLADVCGIAPFGDGFLVTSGTGELRSLSNGQSALVGQIDGHWDNHLVAI